jgi:DNA-binding phage protein
MTKKLTVYDPAEDLDSADAIAVFLTEAFRTEDAGYIAHAFGVVARARGMAEVAARPACPACSSIGHSARLAIRGSRRSLP